MLEQNQSKKTSLKDLLNRGKQCKHSNTSHIYTQLLNIKLHNDSTEILQSSLYML